MLIFDATDNSFGTMSFKITVTSKWISVENIGDGRKTVTTDLPRCLSTMPYIVPNTGNKIDTQYELICGISNDWGPNTRIYKVKKGTYDKLVEFLFDYKEPDLLGLLN